MKKIFLLVIFISSLFLCSCASNKKEKLINQKATYVIDSTGLLKKVNKENLISGILKKENGGYVIYQNYESRSRVSFYINEVESDKTSFEKLSSFIDKEIKVNGEILKEISIWTKEIGIKGIIGEL